MLRGEQGRTATHMPTGLRRLSGRCSSWSGFSVLGHHLCLSMVLWFLILRRKAEPFLFGVTVSQESQ